MFTYFYIMLAIAYSWFAGHGEPYRHDVCNFPSCVWSHLSSTWCTAYLRAKAIDHAKYICRSIVAGLLLTAFIPAGLVDVLMVGWSPAGAARPARLRPPPALLEFGKQFSA